MEASGSSTTQVTRTPGIADFGESLTCTICAEILEGAVSLQPCLHTFCGACASHWIMEQGHESCPECRRKVSGLATNHKVNELVEKYFIGHPDEERTPEEKQKMRRMNLVEQNGGIVQLNSARSRSADAQPDGRQQTSESGGLGWLLGAVTVGGILGAAAVALMSGKKEEKK